MAERWDGATAGQGWLLAGGWTGGCRWKQVHSGQFTVTVKTGNGMCGDAVMSGHRDSLAQVGVEKWNIWFVLQKAGFDGFAASRRDFLRSLKG